MSTLGVVGQWMCGVVISTTIASGSSGVQPRPVEGAGSEALREEYSRFVPLMAAPTEVGEWSAGPGLAAELGGSEWTDARLGALAGRVGRLGRLVEIGRLALAQGSLNEQNLSELFGLGARGLVEEMVGDTQGRKLTEAEVLAKILEMGAFQALGSAVLARAEAERWELVAALCEVADELGGEEGEAGLIGFEVWQEPGSEASGLRATNAGQDDLTSATLRVESLLGGAESAVGEVVFVDSWAAGSTIILPTRLAGMTTAYAPRLGHDAVRFSVWSRDWSWRDATLDMPGYARDQRVPGPSVVGERQRSPTARYRLVDNADIDPMPIVLDNTGEPVPGWEHPAVRPGTPVESARKASDLDTSFRCATCRGTGEVTKVRIERVGDDVLNSQIYPTREVEYQAPCDSCEGRRYAGRVPAGKMDGFTRTTAGVAPGEHDRINVLREHLAGILGINPRLAWDVVNATVRERLANRRLERGTPMWFAAASGGIVRALSGEEFRSVTIGGTGETVALDRVVVESAPTDGAFMAGGLFDGYLALPSGRSIPVLRGAFLAGE